MGLFEIYITVIDGQIIVETGRMSPFSLPKGPLLATRNCPDFFN